MYMQDNRYMYFIMIYLFMIEMESLSRIFFVQVHTWYKGQGYCCFEV